LFALVLILGHATAFAHALTHLNTRDTAPPDKVCEVCVAHAQLGSAMPPAGLVLAIPFCHKIAPVDAARMRIDLLPPPASARAPPALINL